VFVLSFSHLLHCLLDFVICASTDITAPYVVNEWIDVSCNRGVIVRNILSSGQILEPTITTTGNHPTADDTIYLQSLVTYNMVEGEFTTTCSGTVRLGLRDDNRKLLAAQLDRGLQKDTEMGTFSVIIETTIRSSGSVASATLYVVVVVMNLLLAAAFM